MSLTQAKKEIGVLRDVRDNNEDTKRNIVSEYDIPTRKYIVAHLKNGYYNDKILIRIVRKCLIN